MTARMNFFGQLITQAIATTSEEKREIMQQLQIQNWNTEQMVARLRRRMDDAKRLRARVEPKPHWVAREQAPTDELPQPKYEDIHRFPPAKPAKTRERTPSPRPVPDPVPELEPAAVPAAEAPATEPAEMRAPLGPRLDLAHEPMAEAQQGHHSGTSKPRIQGMQRISTEARLEWRGYR
jgi:hypothetical protein